MSASREELLVYGYIKEYHRLNNMVLPPNDLIVLFVSWIRLKDRFDKNKIHENIELDPEIETKFRRKKETYKHADFATVIGTFIIEKGMKQSWTFKIEKLYNHLIGIIDTETIQSLKSVDDFTSEINKGYGLQTAYPWNTYHANDSSADGNLRRYAEQFVTRDVSLIITMELDMTQIENENGVLKYIIHNKPRDKDVDIKTDGTYTNIAYDNIDINQKYRLAFAILGSAKGWNQLVS